VPEASPSIARIFCPSGPGLSSIAIISNQAPTSAYFAQTLQIWEQGRFIRFFGLGQWVGWLWPYAALAYVFFRVSRREPKN